ncbi:NADPH-dependent FMN reductase [Nocardia sp. NPDC051321]|uniref:NADPH-dependent FMN reductase n=1 Tax=Nocardia sp. NPDC051321 TaxID=3364323 RepID=UPI0037948738
MTGARPLIVGIGGTTRIGSTTDRALRAVLLAAERAGARTLTFDGAYLAGLPHYPVDRAERSAAAVRLTTAVRAADGLVLACPSYHGGVSALVKNALDYLEDLRADEYLDGKAIGCVVTAAGWQAGGTTLCALRSIVHALRGWPTAYGATLNTTEPTFDNGDRCLDPTIAAQLETVSRQVVDFALDRRRSASRAAESRDWAVR